MDSFIENYCGNWKDDYGHRLDINLVTEFQVKVDFYRAGEPHPMLRPWFENKPAQDMIGVLDSESQSALDILLAGDSDRFCLNLSFDVADSSYRSVVSSIIRYEEDEHFEKYYHLLGPLGHYKKC